MEPRALTLEQFKIEEALVAELRTFFWLHRPPPMVLGSGRCSCAHKFAATMQALFLEVGSENFGRVFRDLLLDFEAPTTDFGDEWFLGHALPVPIRSVFPWLDAAERLHSFEDGGRSTFPLTFCLF